MCTRWSASLRCWLQAFGWLGTWIVRKRIVLDRACRNDDPRRALSPRNVWSCDACGYQFEDTIFLSAREITDASFCRSAFDCGESSWAYCAAVTSCQRRRGDRMRRREFIGLRLSESASDLTLSEI